MVRLLNTEVSTLTLPAQTNVNSFAIKLSNSKGYVVTEIPKYYFSPVQVIVKNIKDIAFKYYMRSGSSFEPANHDLLSGLYNRQQSSRLISGWAYDMEGNYGENDQIVNYRIKFWIQNKGRGVLRDVWLNFTSSGLRTKIEQTPQTQIFTGWNIFGDALNLITKDDYKCGPQHFIYPFVIDLTILKNSIPDKAFVYISYGADGATPVELNLEFTKAQIVDFLQQPKRKTPNFLEYFKWGNTK